MANKYEFDFDPYYRWLGIPEGKRPVNHYRLLGVSPKEYDKEIIHKAAERQKICINEFKDDAERHVSARLLYEIEEARFILLNEEFREQYNSFMRMTKKKAGWRRRYQRWRRKTLQHSDLPKEYIYISQSSGFVEEFAWIFSIIFIGFVLMAAFTFYLPWQKVVFDRNQDDPIVKQKPMNQAPPAPKPFRKRKVLGIPKKKEIEKKVVEKNEDVKQEKEKELAKVEPEAKKETPEKKNKPNDPKYINLGWIEQQLAQVGIDKLIKEYEGVDDQDVQTVRSTLNLSRHILRDHPEALREQLQARLVSSESPALAHFQTLSKNRIQFRSEWPTFNQPNGPLIQTLKRQFEYVNSLVLTPDGKQLISGSKDNILKVRNIDSGKEINRFGRNTNCLLVTPDGKHVISGNKQLSVWDLSSGKKIQTFKGHNTQINCVAITPDGKQVISAAETLKVWDFETGNEIRTITRIPKRITCVNVTKDSNEIIAGSDKKLWIWDLTGRKRSRTLIGHSDYIKCLELARRGKYAISGASYGTLKVWNLKEGKKEQTLRGHSGTVFCVKLIPNGKQIASGSRDNTLKLWNLYSGELLTTYHLDATVSDIVVSPNGKTLIAGTGNGRIHKLTMLMPGR